MTLSRPSDVDTSSAAAPGRWRRLMRGAAATANDLLPRVCEHELAAAREGGWCVDDPSKYCPRCGASAGPGAVTERGCSRCVDTKPPWRRIARLSAYTSPLSDWIVAMKFARQWTWARWFGRELARLDVVRAAKREEQPTVVCAVPMHWLHRWRRGYNQAALMAEAFAAELKLPIAPLLRRTRRTLPQTQVVITERAANVRDSVMAKPIDLTGYRVWLIDDVKTTGSTLSACVRQLQDAGAAHVDVGVAAVADPKAADFKVM